jgi:protein TonB
MPARPAAPAPSVIAVERTDVAPPAGLVVSPPTVAGEPAAAPAVPVAIGPPSRPEAVEPPRFNAGYLNNPEPPYPPLARRLGQEGLVTLRVQVSAKGKPEQVVVAKTSGVPVLDEAAVKAVQSWTFVPAKQGDTAIAALVEVPIRFRLSQ